MQVQQRGSHGVMGTLKPYHVVNNLFELTALKGSRDPKSLGTSARARATRRNFHYIIFVFNEDDRALQEKVINKVK